MRQILTTAIALALASVSPCTFAQPDSPAPSAAAAPAAAVPVPTQVPRTARPRHYALEITPHADKMTFDGKVRIALDVLQTTDRIVLQAADLRFGRSTLTGGKTKAALVAKVATDADAQTASFVFAKPLAPGSYVLSIDYSGVINTQANGLFALDYATAHGQRRALYTQFENSDARRVLPSWDEPDFKATFDLTVNAPAAQMVVGNMPVAATTDLGHGLKRVAFQTTPKMSTYLLFLGVGDFQRTALKGDNGTEIGVIAQQGKAEQARFALESGRDVLREYNDYFGVRYPLPKLDNIAAPGDSQFFSAMENWGAIFTFEHSLLLDPAVSDVTDRQRVFTTAAHEIAHQWFGDLVTMAWWDDLWLNEGFATWLEGRTTAKLHPEWDIDKAGPAYVNRAAMGRDAYATTHPVVQKVATVEQASQAFDGITYQKGSAVIGMLEDYVGADAWRDGVRRYIKKRAYGNAVTGDLWQEIDAAAPGKQFLQVAHDFTLQPGVPLIKVATSCNAGTTVVRLEQGEYSLDRPDKQPLRWHVPVAVRSGGHDMRVLVDGSAQLQLPGCTAPVLVNAGQKGYYRTLYAPAQFKALADGFATLPVVDQLGVLLDTSALATLGLQPQADLLGLADKVPVGAASYLWAMVSGFYTDIDDLFKGDPKRQAAWRRYALSRLAPEFATLGWDDRASDAAQVKQLRAALIYTLGGMGDAQVIAEARRRFAAFQADPSALSPELRNSVLGIVARNADAATWDALHRMAQKETSSMIRDQDYLLLATAKDDALAQRALDMALTDEPGATNSASMISQVSGEHPDLAFDFAVAHRERVDTLVGTTSRARYYPRLGVGSVDLKMIDKIQAYAQRYLAATSRRDADAAIADIRTRVKLRAQRVPQIKAWLAGRKG
ncbi:aminopeptidase [Xanthomonas translucens pv. arrhenatheri]|uniref:Aminopeptidase n=1 Tax=Xanthomonas graminis pv. arrhenatheri LMG 727 TaxID=1195923 RepID=A0A0K2ZQT9_9XANT|nr:M1 family metallopeptidase [Xanthomonas translucens]OAX66755.1 aminopeptidase [Xanthomonas translucens pv. arrhenatheri]UKE78590.1 M1 family metallopeptidase [Xanthomonas translucens pv. arrhenatheri]CTP87978.1 aminopeptidase N [Xanthomonas translucens pv. arrhenatheri LMG 727]